MTSRSALALAAVFMCSMAAGQNMPETAPSAAPVALTETVRELLAPLVGDAAETVMVESAAAVRAEGEWRIAASVPGEGGTQRIRFAAVVDGDRGYVVELLGLRLLPLASNARLDADSGAAEFARRHLGPWTKHTRLLGVAESVETILIYRWANVLPSGALTGDAWGVLADLRLPAIIGFYQQRAYREVAMEEVKLTRDEAIGKVQALWRDRLGTEAPTVSVTDSKLILSSRFSPDHGPVWMVSVEVNAEPSTHLVDAKTGEMLSLTGQPQGQAAPAD